MKIEIRKSAIKDLKAISQESKTNIHKKIKDLVDFPHLSNIKKLTNFEPAYRLKVGNYRILFDVVDNEKIIVGRVLHRKDSYKNK
jgi:mRNA interferase RelE/StbE